MKKVLNVFSLAMINVIAMDSLRNLPINAEYGLHIIFMYALGTLFFLLPCILITAELATNRPLTGGNYIWVRDAFGEKWGFTNSWLLWIYNVVWFPTILSFIAASIAYLINPALANNNAFMLPVIIGAFLLATLFNNRGIETSSWISNFGAIVGTIIPMTIIIILGCLWLASGNPTALNTSQMSFFPSIHHLGDFAFIVVILFSLIGIEMSAIHAGDVDNPRRNFPRALVISAIIIVISEVLASLSISLIMPKSSLDIVSGVNQAFLSFLKVDHLTGWLPVVILMIIIGGFAGMTAWVLGPARAMSVAAKDGCAPKWLAKTNQRGAPGRMLWLQLIVVLILCSLFLFYKSFNTYFWILSDLTAQLALIYYIMLFAAAIKLRYNPAYRNNGFKIPGGNWGIWLTGCIGIMSCIMAISLGFVPPSSISISNVPQYELTLIIGIIIFILPPLLIARRKSNG